MLSMKSPPRSVDMMRYCSRCKNIKPSFIISSQNVQALLCPQLAGSSKPLHRHLFSLRQTQIFHPQHSKDRIPRECELIYENSQRNIIGPSRVITTVVGIVSTGISFGYLYSSPETLEPGFTYALVGVGLLSAFIVTFINIISRYYILRIYMCKDNKRFIGIYRGFAGKVEHLNYSLTDVKQVKSSRKTESLHLKSNILISGRVFHFHGNDFVLPKYYNMHLGYHK